jgi:hypothetical protein
MLNDMIVSLFQYCGCICMPLQKMQCDENKGLGRIAACRLQNNK